MTIVRLTFLTVCSWTCLFSQTTINLLTQTHGGHSAVAATSTAVIMSPGSVWTPNGQQSYTSPASVTLHTGTDTGLFTFGYNTSGQRVCFYGAGINIANYIVSGFTGGTCTTPAPSTGLYTVATVVVSGGVWGTVLDFRSDAFDAPSTSNPFFDPLNTNTIWFADSFGWSLGPNGTAPPWWFNSGGGSMAAGAPGALDSGVVVVSSGATSGTGMNVYRTSAGSAGFIADFSAQSPFPGLTFKSRVQLLNITNTHFRFGLFSATGLENSANQIGIRFDTSAGDTQWMCEVRSGGSATVTSPSALPAIDMNWHTLTISASATGAVTCAVDGVTTITTAAFPATTWQLGFGIWTKENLVKSAAISDVRGTIQVTGR